VVKKTTKQFIGLARVSSKEQQREGFSLEVQEEAIRRYVEKGGGRLVRLWKIAETASRTTERTTFHELVAYAKKHAAELDGVVFYRVDRAARNMFDYIELERLESEYNLPFISVSQPTENSPAGRMQRRIQASMSSYFAEQLSLDLKQALSQRVSHGLPPGRVPYGFCNVRRDGRSLVEAHPVHGPKIRRIFELYAWHGQTCDTLPDRLAAEGIIYKENRPRFPKANLQYMLRNRHYLGGEVKHRGRWLPGVLPALVDRPTFERAQELMDGRVGRAHELLYAGGLIRCGHCGGRITGEAITRELTTGTKTYNYYRCVQYNAAGHPRIRMKEEDLDRQVLELFARLRVEDPSVAAWFREVACQRATEGQHEAAQRVAELKRQLASVKAQEDKLLNLLLADQIDQNAYTRKQTELRDRAAGLQAQLDAEGRAPEAKAETAVAVFELSQVLREKWLAADYAGKRRLALLLALNWTLDGATLCVTWRKPFELLAEGVILEKAWALSHQLKYARAVAELGPEVQELIAQVTGAVRPGNRPALLRVARRPCAAATAFLPTSLLRRDCIGTLRVTVPLVA
jgi:site-specific DNA recombinase